MTSQLSLQHKENHSGGSLKKGETKGEKINVCVNAFH
jgi:hypothetical protein